jgi:hypothetical protein
MALLFEGFPRKLAPASLKPGRWFATSHKYEAKVCVMTDASDGDNPIVLAFGQYRAQHLDFTPVLLKDLTETLLTIDCDIVFAPAGPAGRLALPLPSRRTSPHGALLQLSGGEFGIGVGGPGGGFTAVSLVSGQVAPAYDLAFDHWSLTLRRGAMEMTLGAYETDARRSARMTG